MWRAIKSVSKRVSSRSPRARDQPDSPQEVELRPSKSSQRPYGSSRRRALEGDDLGDNGPGPPAHRSRERYDRDRDRDRDTERGGGARENRRGRERERDRGSMREPDEPPPWAAEDHARALFPGSPGKEPKHARAVLRFTEDALEEHERLLPQPGEAADTGPVSGDWRTPNHHHHTGYGAVERLWDDEKPPVELDDPKAVEMYERSIRSLRNAALKDFYDTRRRVANILLLGTCALDPALRVGLSVGPNRGVSTLLTPSPWFNAGWAGAFLMCLFYALFQALPAESARPILRRVGWLSGMMFAAESTMALLGSMLTLSTGSLQHFADVWPTPIARHVGAAFSISWCMVFFSIAALYPCGLLLQALAAPQPRWGAEEHLLVAAPLGVFSAWMTLEVGENLAVALLSSGIFELGLGSLSGQGAAVGIIVALTAFAVGFLFAGDGNPYYAVAMAWALIGVAEQARVNFGTFGLVSATASAAAVLLVGAAGFLATVRAQDSRMNQWGAVVPLALSRLTEAKEETFGENSGNTLEEWSSSANTAASQMSFRFGMVAHRLRDLVTGAVQ